MSRHVKFIESLFPFTSLSTRSSRPQPSTIITWIPPPITIPSTTVIAPLITPSEVEAPQQSHCDVSSTTTLVEPSHSITFHTPQPNSREPSPTHNPALNQPPPTHTMTTRAKNYIHKPIQKLNLNTQLRTPNDLEPTTVTQALKDPKWRWAMSEEYDALVRNRTW